MSPSFHEQVELQISAVSELSQPVSLEEAQSHLAKIARSGAFSSAPMLRRLLEYIGAHSADGRGHELKEYTIGVEALDRPTEFDPKTDTLVRVHIHRLREKLSRYYVEEGREDQVLVTIPRGHYAAQFRRTPSIAADEAPLPELSNEPQTEKLIKRRQFPAAIYVGVLACMLGLLFGGMWGRNSARSLSGSVTDSEIDPSIRMLWSSFLGNDRQPIIGYPDAVFLIDESNDLLRYPSGAAGQRGSVVDQHLAESFASNPELVRRAGPLFYEDGYTGTGEIESAAALGMLLHDLGARPEIKRSRDITIEDLQNHNVILLGSSFQNKAVDELPRQGDFRFQKAGPRHELWDGAIENRNPSAGEQKTFRTERDPLSKALRVDYGLISFQPGLNPQRHIVILGGLDTTGTAGAAKFAISKEGASLLLHAVRPQGSGSSPVVQAVVRCVLKDGNSIYDVHSVAVHATEWAEIDTKK